MTIDKGCIFHHIKLRSSELQGREGVKASLGKTLSAGAKRDLNAPKSLFGNPKPVLSLLAIGLCILNHRYLYTKP